jgi:hypothetical protein
MIDELALRRPAFVEGVRIRLANGQQWSFPDRPPHPEDQELIALLQAVDEAEDAHERLRGELALAILLLSRNYDLGPDDYQAILGYPQDDPAIAAMQTALHELAIRQSRDLPRLSPKSNSPPIHSTHWSFAQIVKLRQRLEAGRSFWFN